MATKRLPLPAFALAAAFITMPAAARADSVMLSSVGSFFHTVTATLTPTAAAAAPKTIAAPSVSAHAAPARLTKVRLLVRPGRYRHFAGKPAPRIAQAPALVRSPIPPTIAAPLPVVQLAPAAFEKPASSVPAAAADAAVAPVLTRIWSDNDNTDAAIADVIRQDKETNRRQHQQLLRVTKAPANAPRPAVTFTLPFKLVGGLLGFLALNAGLLAPLRQYRKVTAGHGKTAPAHFIARSHADVMALSSQRWDTYNSRKHDAGLTTSFEQAQNRSAMAFVAGLRARTLPADRTPVLNDSWRPEKLRVAVQPRRLSA